VFPDVDLEELGVFLSHWDVRCAGTITILLVFLMEITRRNSASSPPWGDAGEAAEEEASDVEANAVSMRVN
jgi:hypothetical protein